MAVVVQKYGGSSVADIAKLGTVADLVAQTRRTGHDVVVVVSAMGKTTENLLALAIEASGSGEPPRRELDMLVSTGERVSMALLSIAIQARGFDAISFTGSQSGIITNDRHFDARIIEVRPHRIEDELARGRIVIVAGYQGMSYRREITTLGRGGSDTTAVALAAALGAERCEIYSDIDGVYSADPRTVPGARHLPALDHALMQEMAESGAKVLNAQAVQWAKDHRVTLVARRTADGGAGRETLVAPDTPPAAGPRAVVVQNKVGFVSAPAGAGARFLERAAELGLPLTDIAVSGERLSAVVPLANVPDFERVRHDLEAAAAEIHFDRGRGVVSLVGGEVGSRPERIARALALVDVTPLLVVSTPLRLSVVLPESELARVESAWHAELVHATDPTRLSA